MRRLMLMALAIVLVAGCSGRENTLQILNQTRSVYKGAPELSQNIENLMETVFTETGVPWNDKTWDQVAAARSSLVSIQDRMSKRMLVTSDIPYYTLRAAIEDVRFEYMKLQEALDTRLYIEGALTDQGRELYLRIRQDVLDALEVQKEYLATETKKVDDAATKADLDDLKNVYSTMKPLISMAKEAIL